MRDLIKYVNESVILLNDYGIDVFDLAEEIVWKVSKRAKRRYEQCKYSPREGTEISISEFLLDENVTPNEDVVIGVIIHELLHAITPYDHHGGKWKALANQVNLKSGGRFNIKRCGSDKEYGIKRVQKPKEIKYIVECPDCGAKWTRIRKCKLVKHPEWFVCGKCKVNLRLKSCA